MRRLYYQKFGNMEIPPVNRKEDISSHEAKSGIVETAGGYIDSYGTYSAVTAKSIEIEFDICDDRWQTVDEKVEAWKALVGKKDKLFRRVGDQTQWAYARLMSLGAETDYEGHWGICNVKLGFEIISPSWWGGSITPWKWGYISEDNRHFDAGLHYDQGNVFSLSIPNSNTPASITLVNDGNTFVKDMVMTLEAMWEGSDSAGIIKIRGNNIDSNGQHIPGVPTWELVLGKDTGSRDTLIVSSTMIIDTARKYAAQRPNNYPIYNLVSSSQSAWMPLAPGINELTFSTVNTNASLTLTVTAEYCAKWR